MEDLEVGQPNTEEAPAPEAPAPTPQFDPEALKSALAEEFDKRFRGIQSLVERKTSELDRGISELRAANLSPEEQEQLEVKRSNQRVQDLERENALLKLRKEFPEEVDFLESFFKADSLQSQLDALSGFRKASSPSTPQVEPETTPPTPVSGNNPARRNTPTLADTGTEMNEAMADQIMNVAGNQKGLLRRLIGG